MAEARVYDVAKVYGDIENIKNAQMQNKLAEMKLQEYEKGVAKKTSRDMLAQQYITQGQPEMQQAPQYDMGQGTPNLNQYQTGQAPYQEAIPPSFDRQGYGQGLLGAGDIEGAMQVEAEMQAQKKAEIEEVYNIAKVNPKMGVKVWNKGPLAKEYGTIEHLGVKDGMQIFNNKDDGEIVGVNKSTGEITIIRQGDPTKAKAKSKEKPEYTPGKALSKLSSIDKALVGLKTGGATVDEALVKQFPILAAYSSAEGDPEAILSAIATLEQEREFVQQFAPKRKTKKKLTKEEAMSYLQEAGGDKEKARTLARKDGRTF